MDPEQFKELITTIQEQQQTFFTQIIDRLNDKKSDGPTHFSNITPFENYDPKKEKFSLYLERFENYYTMKGVIDKGKIAQLLCASIGSTYYSNLASFLGPDKPVKT